MITIDLNCDMGESFGAYTIGADAEVMPSISSANVACRPEAQSPMAGYRAHPSTSRILTAMSWSSSRLLQVLDERDQACIRI